MLGDTDFQCHVPPQPDEATVAHIAGCFREFHAALGDLANRLLSAQLAGNPDPFRPVLYTTLRDCIATAPACLSTASLQRPLLSSVAIGGKNPAQTQADSSATSSGLSGSRTEYAAAQTSSCISPRWDQCVTDLSDELLLCVLQTYNPFPSGTNIEEVSLWLAKYALKLETTIVEIAACEAGFNYALLKECPALELDGTPCGPVETAGCFARSYHCQAGVCEPHDQPILGLPCTVPCGDLATCNDQGAVLRFDRLLLVLRATMVILARRKPATGWATVSAQRWRSRLLAAPSVYRCATELPLCEATGTCVTHVQYSASSCDDGNACTTDSCASEPYGACRHAPVSCPAHDDPCFEPYPCDPVVGCLNVALPKPDGTPCGAGHSCQAGACTCTPTSCSQGQAQDSQTCQCTSKCPDGQIDCGGGCVDLSTSADNCGLCGHSCLGVAGSTCQQGDCLCRARTRKGT